MSNAIKYRNPLVDSYLSLQVEAFPDHLLITSEDNGMGIEQQYQESIFRMFFRASEKSDGSGLGLYIAKQAVEKMGGAIQVTSQIRQGTTFTVRLPHRKERFEAENR